MICSLLFFLLPAVDALLGPARFEKCDDPYVVLEGDRLLFLYPGVRLELRPVGAREVLTLLGAEAPLARAIQDPVTLGRMEGVLFFWVEGRNQGREPLHFNPDQITLQWGSRTCRPLSPLHFTFGRDLAKNGDLEELAARFLLSSWTLEPEEHATQWLTFLLPGRRKSGKGTLEVREMYFGKESFQFSARLKLEH